MGWKAAIYVVKKAIHGLENGKEAIYDAKRPSIGKEAVYKGAVYWRVECRSGHVPGHDASRLVH